MARSAKGRHDRVHVGRQAPIGAELQYHSVTTGFEDLEMSIRGMVRTVC